MLAKEKEDIMLMTMKKSVLVGNAFPMSLITRRVVIEPADADMFRKEASVADIFSFWGHRNTLDAASNMLGFDLTPATDRPAVRLSENGYPVLDGCEFKECWLVTARYRPGFRPAVGEEVPSDAITGWQVLRMRWEDE